MTAPYYQLTSSRHDSNNPNIPNYISVLKVLKHEVGAFFEALHLQYCKLI